MRKWWKREPKNSWKFKHKYSRRNVSWFYSESLHFKHIISAKLIGIPVFQSFQSHKTNEKIISIRLLQTEYIIQPTIDIWKQIYVSPILPHRLFIGIRLAFFIKLKILQAEAGNEFFFFNLLTKHWVKQYAIILNARTNQACSIDLNKMAYLYA